MTLHLAHLSEAEFIDLLDGVLPGERREHLDSCAACAEHAATLMAIAREVQETDVPEPPPFFWTQLSARVDAAVASEAARPRLLGLPLTHVRWVTFAASIAAVLLVLVLLPELRSGTPDNATPTVDQSESAQAQQLADEAVDLDSDEAWAVVRLLAEDLDDQEMRNEGVSPGVGAVERLTFQLSEAERIELARLLEEQLRLGRRPESAS